MKVVWENVRVARERIIFSPFFFFISILISLDPGDSGIWLDVARLVSIVMVCETQLACQTWQRLKINFVIFI